jgi:MYXO-CTERM domain-containing protein
MSRSVFIALGAALITACGGSQNAGAQMPVTTVHPRLLVTPDLVASLKARSGDADIVAVMASADRMASSGLDMSYQGTGWSDNGPTLGFAYLMTGDMKYAQPLLAMLDQINTAAAAGDLSYLTVDSTFGSRSTGYALAIAFDWLYPILGSTRIAATVRTVNAYFDYFKAGDRVGDMNGPAYGNYFAGHIIGFGAMGLATSGDNTRADEINTTIRGLFDATVPASFTTGPSKGGFPLEGYVYGSNTFVRLFHYIRMVKTATGETIGSTGAWANDILRTMLEALKPNLFQVVDEGEYTGDGTGLLSPGQLQVFAALADDPTLRSYGRWLLDNHRDPPDATPDAVPPLTRLLFPVTDAAVDYRGQLPTYHLATGAAVFLMRSSWADNAVWASFNAGIERWTDHVGRQAGHFTIQRGTDYLLVNGSQWKQNKVFQNNVLTGYEGEGYWGNTFIYPSSAWENTLFADDGAGAYLLDGDSYSGGQAGFSENQPYTFSQRGDWTYVKFDMTHAYDNNHPEDFDQRAVRQFVRNFVFFAPGNFVVFDRIRVVNTGVTYHLRFHFNSNSPPVVQGGIATSTVGSSRLFLRPVSPAGVQLATAWQQLDGVNFVPRVEVRPGSATTTFDPLTVITAAGTDFPSMPATNPIQAENGTMQGVQILEPQRERVAMFATAETARVPGEVAYSVTSSGARHALFDMMPNASYTVTAAVAGGGVRISAVPGGGDLSSDDAGVLAFDVTGTAVTAVPSDPTPLVGEPMRPATPPMAPAAGAVAGGCGCRVQDDGSAGIAGLLAAVALLGVFGRRRRRARSR